MLDRIPESGNAGSDGDKADTATSENGLRGVPETAAENVAFDKRITVEGNPDSFRVFLNVRECLVKFIQSQCPSKNE